MGINCTRCIIPPLSPPPPNPYPLNPLAHIFSCRWYIYTCICIHDLSIMYTYIHTYIYAYTTKRHTVNNATRGIYMYMYACLFRQERPTYTINHAKFFAQFIRVADTKYGFLLTRE